MQKYNPEIHHRRSIRLADFDYSQPGLYFITIVTYKGEHMLGEIINGSMRLNNAGLMVAGYWMDLALRFPTVTPDSYIVMPNHFHGIICINDWQDKDVNPGAASSAPTTPSLGEIMRALKSTTAIQINRMLARSGSPFWQRNYYEHIIRNEDDLERIRQYIEDNPSNWHRDKENPESIL